MRAVPGFVVILALMAVVALAVADWGERNEGAGIYANGVFLTTEMPDVPGDAGELLRQMATVHTAEDLKSALSSGVRVVIYDCSASELVDGDFWSRNLPNGYSLVGINVERQNLRAPPGCTRAPDSEPFFSFDAALADNGKGSCGGYGGSRFSEGLFRAHPRAGVADEW